LEKGVFQAQGGGLVCLAEEKLEESLVNLKLLAEEKLVESLVRLRLLIEEKLDPSLVRLKLLLEKRMAGSLVKLELSHAEEKNSPWFGSPKFPLQIISRGKCQ
jgi:adenosylmethionine-8-amino-7-oxononanoate aminotransferase